MRSTKARLGGLFLAFSCTAGGAFAQDAANGRALYVGNCAVCHADPPGSGSVNPMVRTADEIRGAISRVSPMGFLGSLLTDQALEDIAAYFVSLLGEPVYAPDFGVGDVWWDPAQSGWGLFLREHSNRTRISGSWYTYDAGGRATWFLLDGGTWSAPGTYVAKLYRTTGSPLGGPHDPAALRAMEIGTVALVFSNRDLADATFIVDGERIAKKITRFFYPK